jgi:hypothetical protein
MKLKKKILKFLFKLNFLTLVMSELSKHTIYMLCIMCVYLKDHSICTCIIFVKTQERPYIGGKWRGIEQTR